VIGAHLTIVKDVCFAENYLNDSTQGSIAIDWQDQQRLGSELAANRSFNAGFLFGILHPQNLDLVPVIGSNTQRGTDMTPDAGSGTSASSDVNKLIRLEQTDGDPGRVGYISSTAGNHTHGHVQVKLASNDEMLEVKDGRERRNVQQSMLHGECARQETLEEVAI